MLAPSHINTESYIGPFRIGYVWANLGYVGAICLKIIVVDTLPIWLPFSLTRIIPSADSAAVHMFKGVGLFKPTNLLIVVGVLCFNAKLQPAKCFWC